MVKAGEGADIDGPRGAEREVAGLMKRELRSRRLAERVACGRSLIYISTASLCHLPRSLISSLDNPFFTADTAAPFHNECPEKPQVGIPALRRYSLTLSMKKDLEKAPSVRLKSGELGEAGQRVVKS